MIKKTIFSSHFRVPTCAKILPFTDKHSYREFSSVGEAKTWAEANYGDWSKKHKEIMAASARYPEPPLRFPDAMDMYFGYRYKQINESLRSCNNTLDDYALRRDIMIMSIAILSAPVIKEKIILYRQVSEDVFRQLMDDGSYVESGFMSTSLVKKICSEACGDHAYMLKLYVNTVSPIHSVYANLVRKRNEMELVLQPGLKLRVIDKPYYDRDTEKIVCDTLLMNAPYSNVC